MDTCLLAISCSRHPLPKLRTTARDGAPFCVCTMLCVRLMITLSKKRIVLVLSDCHLCKRLQRPCACCRLAHLRERKKSIVDWPLALLEKPCCVGAEGFVLVLNKNIYVNPRTTTLWPKWHWTKIGGGPVCLVVLIACIGNGNCVLLPCSGHIKIRTKTGQSSWRLCVTTSCGFSMHSLAFLVGTMILMFSIGALLFVTC